jgi:hypothetical protein
MTRIWFSINSTHSWKHPKYIPFDGVQHVENVYLLDYLCELQSTTEKEQQKKMHEMKI